MGLFDKLKSMMSSAEPGPTTTVASSAVRARVLCVDDNEALLKILKRHLQDLHDTTTVSDGSLALELMQREAPFDVIISDLKMPGLHGLSFLKRAREMAPDTERIILTGFIDPTTMAVARGAAGAGQLLTKPYTKQELLDAVHDAVVRRRAREAAAG